MTPSSLIHVRAGVRTAFLRLSNIPLLPQCQRHQFFFSLHQMPLVKSSITNQFSFVRNSFFSLSLEAFIFYSYLLCLGCTSFKIYVGHLVSPFTIRRLIFRSGKFSSVILFLQSFVSPVHIFFSLLFVELLFDRWWILVFISLTFPSYFSPFKLKFCYFSFQPFSF